MKIAKGLLSVVGIGSTPKAEGAQVSTAPIKEIQDESASAKKARVALFQTPGGVAGEELNPDQVKKRTTLLGN